MARKLFESYKRLATRDEIAAQLTHDAIDEIEQLRKGREDEPHTPQEQDIMARLAVLMVGPRKHAVIPVVKQRFPQMAMMLERKLGLVHKDLIHAFDGKHYKFVLVEGEQVPDGSKVSFLPTDDGMARSLQVIP